jgi:hypothetical protein
MRSSRVLVTLAALLGLGSPSPAVSDESRVAERILVVVDTMPVLLSETQLLAKLTRQDTKTAQEALVDELLMYREAARLPQASVSPEEVARIVEDLERTHPDLVAQTGEQGVARLARRQATILRYVEFRFRPQIRIADESIIGAWRTEHPNSAEAPTNSDLEALRERLERRDLDVRVEAWVAELRRQARLRYNPSPVPLP